MQTVALWPRPATLLSGARDWVKTMINAQWAAKDLARYHQMTDTELALRGMTRDDIVGRVCDRYLTK